MSTSATFDHGATPIAGVSQPAALDLLLSRRSVGQLTEPAPEGEELEWILDAGLRAPDHGRLRPWQFVIIRGEARPAFAEFLVDALKLRDPNATNPMEERIRTRIRGVPLIIAMGTRFRVESPIPEIEQLLSTGAAAANMLNAIHMLGYGGMWVTGAHTYDHRVNEALGFTAPDRLIGLLYVGTAKMEPPVWPRRDPLESTCRHASLSIL